MCICDCSSYVCSSDRAECYVDQRRVSPVWKVYAPGVIAVSAQASHDEEVLQTRIDQSVESTIQKIARGKPTQGWPTLAEHLGEEVVQRCKDFVFGVEEAEGHTRPLAMPEDDGRSEERRVGKACVSTGRSRWSPSH